ncbi:MAG: hypothetical protein QF848_15330 [Planctomycetota bacterium]|jgi:hypothetical protein|nr:hypothetical protein [Planctomycetota bacterium]
MRPKPTVTTDIHLTGEDCTRFEVELVARADRSPLFYYILKLAIPAGGLSPLTIFADERHLTQLRDELLARFPLPEPEPEPATKPEPFPEPDFAKMIARILSGDVALDVEGVEGPFTDPHSGGIYLTRKGDDALIYCTPGWEGVQGIAIAVVRDGENVHDEHIPAMWVGASLADARSWRGYMVWWLKQYRNGGAR